MPTFRDDLHLGHSVPMVDTEDIVDGAITEPKLADDSVSTRTIQDGAVTEPKIAEKAVTEPKLADAAVSTRTIKFRAVTESKIGDSAVSTRTIQNGAVTNPKIANGAVSMNKLDNETQTLIQRGADSSWTPMGDYDVDALYYANDLVFDPETNSSYLSLRADNMGHAVTDEEWWMKVVDGSYVNVIVEELEQAIAQAIEDAQEDIDDAIAGANTAAQSANTAAANAEAKIDWVEEQVESLVAYEVDDELDEESIIPVQNKVVTEKFGEVTDDIDTINSNIKFEGKNLFNVGRETASTSNTSYITPATTVSTASWTIKAAGGNVGRELYLSMPTLEVGKTYVLSFDYVKHLENNAGLVLTPSIVDSHVAIIGSVPEGEGTFVSKPFVYSSDMLKLAMSILQVTVGDKMTWSNIKITEVVAANDYINQQLTEIETATLKKGIDVSKNLLFTAQRLTYWPHTTNKKWASSTSVFSYVIPIIPDKEYYYEGTNFQCCFLKDISNASTLNADVHYSYYQVNTAYDVTTFGGAKGIFKAPSDANYLCLIVNAALHSFSRMYLRDDIYKSIPNEVLGVDYAVEYAEYQPSQKDTMAHSVLQDKYVTNGSTNENACLLYIPIRVCGGYNMLISPKVGVGVNVRTFADKGNMASRVLQMFPDYYEDYSGRPFVLSLREDAKYLMLQIRIQSGSTLSVNDVSSLFTSIVVPREKTTIKEVSGLIDRYKEKYWNYIGEKIIPRRNTFTAKYIFPHLDVASTNSSSRQGCAVFRNYFFQIYVDGYCKVLDLEHYDQETVIASFNLGCFDSRNHCNAAQFATTINASTGFPYLYVTLGVMSSDRGIAVEKISINDGVWSSELVQMIKVVDTDGTTTRHGDWIIGDDGYLYGCYTISGGVKYVKMQCPAIPSSYEVTTLNIQDAVFTWVENWSGAVNTWQGCMMYNQRFYHLFGTESVRREIRVFDVNSGKLTSVVPLNNVIAQEPEDLDIWEDKIIISCNASSASATKGAGTYLLWMC